MTIEEFERQFSPLAPQEKIKFLYTHIETLGKEERIVFLLSLLKQEEASPLVKATALKFLREASYQDSEVYKSFVEDDFRAIANAAKRAVREFDEKGKKDGYYSDAVLRKLSSLSDKDRRLKVLKAMSRLQAPWVLRVLLEGLTDPCEANREFLIKELTRREIWNPSLVYEKLTKPPWYTKSAVLRVLGLRRDSGAVSAIKKVLPDPNVDVRRSAAEALGEIGGKEALDLLIKLTKDGSAYVRQAATDALRKVSSVRFSG
jgi:hypothetical protein